MSLVFLESFDTYDTVLGNDIANNLIQHWTSVVNAGVGTNVFSLASGRFSGFSLEFGNDSLVESRLLLNLPNNTNANLQTVVYGFNFTLPSANISSNYSFLTGVGNTTDPTVGINFDSAGIQIIRPPFDNFTTAAFDLLFNINDSNWHSMEVETTRISATRQRVRVFLDDALIYDSNNFGDWFVEGQGNDVFFKHANSGSIAGTGLRLDDFYALDNTGTGNNQRIGSDFRIETLLPEALSGAETWTATGGTAVDAVDNIPFNPVTSIGTTTTDLLQQYEIQNLNNIQFPAGGQIRTVARGDAGTAFEHTVNGVSIETFNVTESFEGRSTIFDADGLLNVSDINGIVAGVRS